MHVQKWFAMSNLQKYTGQRDGCDKNAFSCSRVGSVKLGVSLEHLQLMVLMSIIRVLFSADFDFAKHLALGASPGGEIWSRPSERTLVTKVCKAGSYEWC